MWQDKGNMIPLWEGLHFRDKTATLEPGTAKYKIIRNGDGQNV